ncbi:MAG: hypothetical protein ACFE9Q_10885 [Candidatus Hodarchaeota archaeon]
MIFFYYLIFGIYCLYQSRKKNVNLLLFLGLASIFGGLLWLGNIIDFFSILITGFNIDNTYGFVGISCLV